jgi:hypothetical protein
MEVFRMAKLTEEQRQQRALKRARREALEAEEDDRRNEEQRQRWKRDGAYLSREEFEAGVPCRGCGKPLIDGLGSWTPLMHMTPEERSEYDEAGVSFKEQHGECRAPRWSMSGSRATHCGYCCPPNPMSERQIQKIRRILGGSVQTKKKDLDDWDLTLTCDHVVRRTQHRDHDQYSTHVVDCPACGARRGVVQTERVGPTEDLDELVQKERLTIEIQSAKAKLERQRKSAGATERRIDELTRQLGE